MKTIRQAQILFSPNTFNKWREMDRNSMHFSVQAVSFSQLGNRLTQPFFKFDPKGFKRMEALETGASRAVRFFLGQAPQWSGQLTSKDYQNWAILRKKWNLGDYNWTDGPLSDFCIGIREAKYPRSAPRDN